MDSIREYAERLMGKTMVDQQTVMHIHFWGDIRNLSGSVEKVITTIASAGVDFQHLIACCPGNGVTFPDFEWHGSKVITFKENMLLNRLLNKILGLRAFTYFDLVRKIKEIRPDILHFHNRQEMVDSVISRLDYRPAIVVQYHRNFSNPVIPSAANNLIFVSEYTAKNILKKTGYKGPATVIYNPVSLGFECNSNSIQSNGIPVMVFGGGNTACKGGKELLAAISVIPKGSVKCIIAGPDANLLYSELNGDIQVVGMLSSTEFECLLEKSDIVAVPSHDEAFGLVALEAMVKEKLVISSGAGGLSEFCNEDNSILVNHADVNSISDGILKAIRVLSDSEELQVYRQNMRAETRKFQKDVVVRKIELIYKDIITPA